MSQSNDEVLIVKNNRIHGYQKVRPTGQVRSFQRNEIRRMLSIPRNRWVISPDDVREELLDKIEDFEQIKLFQNLLKDSDYEFAIVVSIIDFNYYPPRENFGPDNFFDPFLLLEKAQIEALDSRIKYHAMNYFTASSGGTTVPVNEQWQPLQMVVNQMEADVKNRTILHKRLINNHAGFGSVPFTSWGYGFSNYGY